MQVKILRGKIYRATVTGTELDYEGSVALDAALMHAARTMPHREVEIWNVTNGERLQTYAVPAPSGSGVVCLNGAAARKVCIGDLVIVAAYGCVDEEQAVECQPCIVLVDASNQPVEQWRSVAV